MSEPLRCSGDLAGPLEVSAPVTRPIGASGPLTASYFALAPGPVGFVFDSSGSLRAGQAGATGWLPAHRGEASVAFGLGNTVSGDYSSTLGGIGNQVSSQGSAIVSGHHNQVTADGSFVGGGYGNHSGGVNSVVVGGAQNRADDVLSGVVAGELNVASGRAAAVLAGVRNTASGEGSVVVSGERNHASGSNSAILGGCANRAVGVGSIALGSQALAVHDHSIVLSDGTPTPSTSHRSLTACYSGGYVLNTGQGTRVSIPAGSSTLAMSVNHHNTENRHLLDPVDTLGKLAQVPVYRYNFVGGEPEQFYRGMLAEDWHKTFPSGSKNATHLELGDIEGLTVSALQGLLRRVETLERELSELRVARN
jgi:hypothetical protein